MKTFVAIFIFGFSFHLSRGQIIDMHLHCYDWLPPGPKMAGLDPSQNLKDHFEETYKLMQENNIVLALASGKVAAVDNWKSQDVENRLLRGYRMQDPSEHSVIEFEKLAAAGRIDVFGEIGAYYVGLTLADSSYIPYLEICEKYDIPVAVHTGGAHPLVTNQLPKARLSLADPYLIEDVLVRHKKLRIYLMHCGGADYNHALRLMKMYPQLYADIGAYLWVDPMTMEWTEEILRKARQYGLLNRIMFGTDQMIWPKSIIKSIEKLKSFDFLSSEDLENIFYNNASRFLGLTESQRDAHFKTH